MKILPLLLGHSPADGGMAGGGLGMMLRQCRHALTFVFLLTFVIEVLGIAPIMYMLNMYDRVLSTRSEVTLVSLTVLIIAIYVFWAALEWIRTRMLVRISLRIDWDLASDVFDASFRRYVGRRKVNVNQLMGDLLTIRQFLTASPLLALMSMPFAVVFILIGAIFHPYLALFTLFSAALLLTVTYLTNRVTTPILREASEASAEANRIAEQSLRLSESALGLGMHVNIRKRWYERHQAYLHMQVGASEAAGLMGGVSGVFGKMLPSLQLALGVYLASQGLITGGMVIAASMLIAKAIAPIQRVLGSWKEITEARQAYERLEELLSEEEIRQQRIALPPPEGNLSVSDVIGVPPGSRTPVLMGINFTAAPGEVIAMIGASAAGKTSLIRLLVGIWRPAKGSVRLDGADISDWIHDNLGQYMGYVPQDVDFFEGSVAENIARLGEVNADKVVAAAKLAGIHEMILALPQGYETKLGQAGHALTGGQKQRLALARALYGDPSYIVMDEPNANLDETGEQALMKTIRELKAMRKTIVFSSHRQSLIGVADKLLVLSEGRQLAFGPLSDMLAAVRQQKAKLAAVPSQSDKSADVAQRPTAESAAA